MTLFRANLRPSHTPTPADLLARLGDTADAVADRLLDLEVQGQRGLVGRCPLTTYLVEFHPRFAGWWVGDAHLHGPDGECEPLTVGVAAFARRFDAGAYRELEEGR